MPVRVIGSVDVTPYRTAFSSRLTIRLISESRLPHQQPGTVAKILNQAGHGSSSPESVIIKTTRVAPRSTIPTFSEHLRSSESQPSE